MSCLTPLSTLLNLGRPPDSAVYWTACSLVRWGDFARRIRGLTHGLRRSPAQRWLLACTDAGEFAVGLMALMQAGKEILLPPSLLPDVLDGLSMEVDARLGRLDELPYDPDMGTASPFLQLDPQHVHIALYTSGSSGRPQKILKTLAMLEAEIQVLESCWGNTLGDAGIVSTVPHHHIYGLLFRLLWPLSAGRPFDTVQCAQPHQLLDRIALTGATGIVSSPAQLNRMGELIDLNSLRKACRLLFSSGGPLAAPAAKAFALALDQAPLEIYGSTETGGIAWRRQQFADEAWTPLPGVQVRAGPGGELELLSPFVESANWQTQADAVTLLPDGRFRLLGRLDRVVKVEEKRLSLPDMENMLNSHSWVSESALVSLEGRRHILGAVIVLSSEGELALIQAGRTEIIRTLKQHLAHHFDAVLLPRRWRFVDNLPVNERSKLTVSSLRALFTEPPPK